MNNWQQSPLDQRSRVYRAHTHELNMIGSLLLVLGAIQLAASNEYLLPGDVEPTNYDVRLLYSVDHAKNFPFFGVVDIQLKIKRTTSKIVLHASEYTIANDSVQLTGDKDSPRVNVVGLDTKYDLLTLEADRELKEGENYSLIIPFFGNLKLGLDGVYVSSYVHKVTKAREYLITTQFEAISARKGFPCFDEPIYKATFKMSIGHNKDYTAVSNMPLDNTSADNILEPYWSGNDIEQKFNTYIPPRTHTPFLSAAANTCPSQSVNTCHFAPGEAFGFGLHHSVIQIHKSKSISQFVWDEFKSSVPMSTYLVAFVISKFQYVDSPPALSTTKFRIWARSDAIDQTAYAATIGPKVLSYFEDWFNVSFPLPKQDMVAIPDFSAGAMENWGLITYRETALLYDKEQSSFLSKERVAEVIAHELAHQWFGNLVTMKWWSDLWLNEGFATFMASVGVSAVEPTWRADRSYAVDNILSVLSLDALESSHPVSVSIENPSQISEIFDEISYRKGSTLIRMMEMFLGEVVFREALHKYLLKYSYQNAEQDDLWAELTEASKQHGGFSRNVSVKEVMDTWTTQTGYPLLTVHRDYSDGSLAIKQKRYLARGLSSTTKASWWVPLRVLCEEEVGQDEKPLEWLAAAEGVSSLHRYEHGSKTNQWVLFNPDMIAPYRVNYDERNWALLSRALEHDHTKVPVLGRVQLLSDAFELAWTNILDYNTTLQLAKYLRRETEILPLSTALEGLGKIDNVLKRTPDYGAFQKFVRHLIGETYAKVGGLAAKKILNKDNLNSVKMQVLTSGWACRMKVPGCEENAIELFRQWMNTENPDENNPIPLDLRRSVYCVALSRGSVQHWRFALARKQRTNVASAREALLHSLACTKEVWILAQYLEWAIQPDSEVRKQDAGSVIAAIVRSTVGYYVAKDFIYTRIEDISKVFSGQTRRIGSIIKVMLAQFTTQRELDEFLKWREQNSKYLEEAKLAVEQAIERASVNIAWLQRNRRQVVDKLRELSK